MAQQPKYYLVEATALPEIFLKVAEAKRLISEGKYRYTEIAEMLGFGSIHYFSRTFKLHTNMTPSGYEKSVKARALL